MAFISMKVHMSAPFFLLFSLVPALLFNYSAEKRVGPCALITALRALGGRREAANESAAYNHKQTWPLRHSGTLQIPNAYDFFI